jgi:hypothetical protein
MGVPRALLLLLVLACAGCGGSGAADTGPDDAAPPSAPAGGAPRDSGATAPAGAGEPARKWRWDTARVIRRTALRIAPGGRRLAMAGPRTDLGGHRFVSVVGRRGPWLRIVAPERPNGRTAWMRASATRAVGTDISVHIDVSARTLVVRDGRRAIHRMPVGVGGADNPTPTGRFAVTDKLTMGGPGTTYGCCAIALSGHQTRIPPGWPGGDRLAVHGTRFQETIGHAASLGCMRARERDLQRLMRTLPLGAPVFIRA